ncbi:uncharacterized protein PG986_013782 [Apiospora aurea]|uniref:4Fe-4S ferredoxin-type domain-containing protein n=1 Tax=Apiospora aurea TaxID=335848 RepID=A0ABR1PWL1_9PEZI
MRFSILTAIFATALGVAAQETCEACCNICAVQVGDGIHSNLELGSCWGNCQAYLCHQRCPGEKYNPE